MSPKIRCVAVRCFSYTPREVHNNVAFILRH